MSAQKTIRWGMAGTGAIARRFVADMAFASGAKLAAVCTRDPAKAHDFASRHAGVEAFTSLEDMIASGAVDAVYLATPNHVHHPQALDCIAANIPVLVEKPLAMNLAEALEIEAAACSAGSFVMEAMWSRYLPAIAAARTALRAGAVGKIKRFEADLAYEHAYDPYSRLFDKAQGGGALNDLGVYPISLARFLLGEPDAVEGSWRAAPSGVDIAATINLRFGKVEAEITCGFDRDGDNRMIVEGDRGVMVIAPPFIKADGIALTRSRRLADLAIPGGGGLSARIRRKLFRLLPVPGTEWRGFAFPGSGLQFEIEAASAAIRQGLEEEPDSRLEDSIAALRIIDAVLSQTPEPN